MMAALEMFDFDDDEPELWVHTLEYDMSVVESDRHFDEPVIYLRINLRSTDKEIKKRVIEIVCEKREKLRYKTQSHLKWNAQEKALMIYDLDRVGFTDEQIADLMSQSSRESVSEHSVKVSLKLARHRINNSIRSVEEFLSNPA